MKKNKAKSIVIKAAAAASQEEFQNGLGDALFPNPFGTQFGIGNQQQISQPATIIDNLRYSLISNLRTTLSWAYVELGLVQIVCTIPVQDALKGGLEISTNQLEPEEIEELESKMEDEDDLATLEEGAVWNRLYGGAGIITVTDANPTSDFDINEIKKGGRLGFKAADLWELYWATQQQGQSGEQIFNPNDYSAKNFAYYGLEVSKTRVSTMKGIRAPSFLRPTLRGWGCSVVETLVRALNQYLKSNDLIFEVLDEFKVDVFKIKNLANTLLQAGGTQKIMNRIQLANMQKNFQHALTMDSEDDFAQKELSFAGISETMLGIKQHVACEVRMPLTKLFGVSAAGFSSGEDDIDNYNSMIDSAIRPQLKRPAKRIVQCRCQQLFGYVPDDLKISFKPLKQLSAEQEENVKTSKHARVMSTWTAGGMTTEEMKQSMNKDKLLPVQIDTSVEKIEMEPQEATAEKPAETKKSELTVKGPKQ